MINMIAIRTDHFSTNHLTLIDTLLIYWPAYQICTSNRHHFKRAQQ